MEICIYDVTGHCGHSDFAKSLMYFNMNESDKFLWKCECTGIMSKVVSDDSTKLEADITDILEQLSFISP
ncbi:hypothetical protein H5410_039228 [Solanum commersonii]|uniref:Uncharacterized protein n=1 Tax=Solanum commersonii TaxID=4109 RepID=A0A9J5YFG4_SOLCO|nr:hypothetical protein H5410_039228 [Solanum commersonii]